MLSRGQKDAETFQCEFGAFSAALIIRAQLAAITRCRYDRSVRSRLARGLTKLVNGCS